METKLKLRPITMKINPHFTRLLTLFLMAFCTVAQAQTIAEKKKGLAKGVTDLGPKLEADLIEVNQQLELKRENLNELYADVDELYKIGAPAECFEELVQLINKTRSEIREINQKWQEIASQSARTDIYALWHQPERLSISLSSTTVPRILYMSCHRTSVK